MSWKQTKKERGTEIGDDLQGWAGERSDRAAGGTGDSFLLGKRHHWGPGKDVVWGLRL